MMMTVVIPPMVMMMKLKWIYPAIKKVNKEERTAEFIFSTPEVDRHGEIVDSSWKLSSFKRNPVVLYAHNSSALPIGRVINIELVNNRLQGTIKFATEKANPEAEKVFQLVEEKILKAVSVGFFVGKIDTEEHDGREVVVLRNNELVEVSVVPVGANRQALLRAYKALGVSSEVLPMVDDDVEIEYETLADDYDKLVEEYATLAAGKEALLKESTRLMEDFNKVKAENMALNARLLNYEISQLPATELEKQILIKLHRDNPRLYKEQVEAIKARPESALFQRVVPPDKTEGGRDFQADDKELAGLVRTAYRVR